jgi:hypothetical protein
MKIDENIFYYIITKQKMNEDESKIYALHSLLKIPVEYDSKNSFNRKFSKSSNKKNPCGARFCFDNSNYFLHLCSQ